MQDVRRWLEEHVWAVATVGLALIVFGVTFIAVSTAADSPSAQPDPVVITVEPETPAPSAEPATETPPEPIAEPADAPSDAPPDQPALAPSGEAGDETPAAGGEAPAAAAEPPAREEAPAVAAPIEPAPEEPAPDGEDDAQTAPGAAGRAPPEPGEGPDYGGPDRPPERPAPGGEPADPAPPAEPQEPEQPEEPEEPEEPDPPAAPDPPEPPEAPEEPEPPAEPPSTLPPFDEEALIYGGAGAEGAILAGPGIVPSSGASARTSWELLLPSARIRASLVRIGLTWNRALGAPDNPHVIGWWKDGPAPGENGNVLLAGHRDFTDTNGNIGIGVCWLLDNTTLGDFLIIRDHAAREHYVYTVTEVVSVLWNDPAGVAYLRPSDTAIATLVTCEGLFDQDTNNYSNRRIVVAELTDTVPFTG